MIITCTTIPPRMRHLPIWFANLGRQKVKPEAVELYVPRTYRRFPGEVPALPALPPWVKVIRIDEDLGPATKVLPAAQRYRGKDVDLLFGDDDRLYDRDWTTRFAATRAKAPDDVICECGLLLEQLGFPPEHADTPERPKPVDRERTRLERIARRTGLAFFLKRRALYESWGYFDTFAGFGGVMVKPDWFDETVYDIPDVLWTVDDIWMSGHLVRKGRNIRSTDRPVETPTFWMSDRAEPLYKFVEMGAGRKEANTRCVKYFQQTYGIWLPQP